MEVKRINAIGNSCNFCRKGKLNESGSGLTYPYKDVLEIKGNGVAVTMCDECVKELIEKRAT